MNWISSKDSLPTEDCRVIVAIYDGSTKDSEYGSQVIDAIFTVDEGFMEEIIGGIDHCSEFVPCYDKVTHWMDWPKAPKKP